MKQKSANKTPKNIFIDTSIFVKENFLHGTRIKTILNLCKEGHFQLVLPLITVNEIKAQFKKQVKSAIRTHNEIINDKGNIIRPLKNYGKANEVLVKFPDYKIVSEEFENEFDAKLKEANAIIIPYTHVDITSVFEDYFLNRFPFNVKDKKHEFPDAFAMITIEQWCIDNKAKCTVFAKDNDFIKKKSRHFNVNGDYEEFISKYLKSIDPKRFDILQDIYDSHGDFLEKEIKEWLRKQLSDSGSYDSLNLEEIHKIEIKKLDWYSSTFQPVYEDESDIEAELSMEFHVKVILTIDDIDSAVYDMDIRDTVFMNTIKLRLEKLRLEVSAMLRFRIVDENDFDDKCEILYINEGRAFDVDIDWDFKI